MNCPKTFSKILYDQSQTSVSPILLSKFDTTVRYTVPHKKGANCSQKMCMYIHKWGGGYTIVRYTVPQSYWLLFGQLSPSP